MSTPSDPDREDQLNALWHAFHALDEKREGTVQKSKLKVLTHSLGTVVYTPPMEDVEKHFGDQTVTFQAYADFVKSVIFQGLSENSIPDWSRFDQVCWQICSGKHLSKDRREKTLTDNHAFQVWQMFNRLAEPDRYPLVMDIEEVQFLLQKLVGAMGGQWAEADFHHFSDSLPTMSVWQLIACIETRYSEGIEPETVCEAVTELHKELVLDVVKEGLMSKKGHVRTNWKERWFVLKPCSLVYYTSKDQKDKKGEILNPTPWKVELLGEKSREGKQRLLLTAKANMSYEMAASDLRSRQAWITAIQSVIDLSKTGCSSLVKKHAQKRREMREKKRAEEMKEKERKRKDSELMEEQRQKLEEEKQARSEAEARLAQETVLREEEEQMRRELEEMNRQLEKLLDEERQAKKDEEIVRALQAKLLQEEFERREQLEKLKTDQDKLLEDERKQRQELEQQWREEQQRLEQLQQEREAADQQLKEASQKLQDAEEKHKKMMAAVEERKRWKAPGLARPIQPTARPLITHRGLGAFTQGEFEIQKQKKLFSEDSEPHSEEGGTGESKSQQGGEQDEVFDDEVKEKKEERLSDEGIGEEVKED
ncbi:switch-associated protein 70-like [Branchiostoma lanceolatum]|uniref:switch-associated protein 70-like n=1 Tax=Branchiostoma lanceolatum TaxID=7740 RepID=UPI003452A6C1